ncbi:hypothetical protein PQR68_24180 [Paraburkholderia agricolaris]|uniref:hypothetical protein n=1 Tax=Paraburkholderia agricolaris TaxID=2152888 RepID=UPI00129124B8|nr:hypothetical protein [Paraburkholderia agricolaris]
MTTGKSTPTEKRTLASGAGKELKRVNFDVDSEMHHMAGMHDDFGMDARSCYP